MSHTQKAALRMLNRKHGATVETLSERLSLEEKQARSLVDNLRRAGFPIENVAPHRFKVAA